MTAVLVIEDDGVIARAMGAHLRTSGFDVEWADDGTKGLRKLRFERPDVCVVDLMLPGLDGWGLIERARDEGLMTPILAVSARGNEHDKVATLALGADDYLAKPFGMAEFMARVQALARRARIAPPSEREQALEFPGLRIDPAQHRAFLLGTEGAATDARLTRTEFRLPVRDRNHRNGVRHRADEKHSLPVYTTCASTRVSESCSSVWANVAAGPFPCSARASFVAATANKRSFINNRASVPGERPLPKRIARSVSLPSRLAMRCSATTCSTSRGNACCNVARRGMSHKRANDENAHAHPERRGARCPQIGSHLDDLPKRRFNVSRKMSHRLVSGARRGRGARIPICPARIPRLARAGSRNHV